MTNVINDEATVVAWFANHQFPVAKLREMTVQKLGKAKELVRAAAIRFGTHTLVGERLIELMPALQATVVDADYVAKNYKDAANTEEQTGTGKTVRSNKGATTKKLVLDDEGFWRRVGTHVATTKPLLKMLRRFDSSAPAIGKVYSSWFEVGEHLEQSTASYKEKAVEKHADRWAYGHSAIAAAAYVLDPEFIEHAQASNEEVTEGFMTTVEKIAILRMVREQCEVKYLAAWKERSAAIGEDPAKLTSYDKFPVYPTTKDKDVKAFSLRNGQPAAHSHSTAPRRASFHGSGLWTQHAACPLTCGETRMARVALNSSMWPGWCLHSPPPPPSASGSTRSLPSSR